MFYTEKRTEENKRRLRRDVFKMLLAMLPFFALCAAGFAVRNQTLCTAGLILTCAAAIFVGDLFVMPSIRPLSARADQRPDAQDGGNAGARRR